MRNFIVITASLLCSLSWISVSGSESQTVDVQSGEDVTLLCSNFSSTFTQIIWFRVVSRSQPRCVSSMFEPFEAAKFCEGFQTGKFEMRTNLSTLFLKIKQVNSSDSGLYFCGYRAGRDTVIVSATYLQVQEESDGMTNATYLQVQEESDVIAKLIFVILGGLTVLLTVAVICLTVKIKKLQRAHVEEQNPQQTEGSDELTYAAVTFRPKAKSNHRPAPEGEVDTNSPIYAATR